MNKIKWGCIQPLTGGMYFGARTAIGHPADWVLSYPGLTAVKRNKEGEMTSVGNEYGLLKWCKEHNELPPYQLFNKKPFQDTPLTEEFINDPDWSTTPVDLSDTDIVVSVPVCSGLSQATIAGQDTKDERNCNMIWNTKFALGVVKPKVYIFENAPALFSTAGSGVRDILNNLGQQYGYAVVYYKTDTKLHDNCQRRPRTFVLFIKNRNGKIGTPDFNFENLPISIEEFFSRIPDDATQQETVKITEPNKLFIEYIKHKFGEDYRSKVDQWMLNAVIKNDLYDDICAYVEQSSYSDKAKKSLINLIKHIKEKIEAGKNYYCMLPSYIPMDAETTPSVMFKSIPSALHYKEDRLFTIRELLHEMGMPHDYELPGDINANYAKIGQNVPARTAQWITSEAVRIVENWDTLEFNTNKPVLFVDNVKQKVA